MTTVSTHILDTALGRPAAGVPVTLDVWSGGTWVPAGGSVTGPDGRITDLPPIGPPGLASPGTGLSDIGTSEIGISGPETASAGTVTAGTVTAGTGTAGTVTAGTVTARLVFAVAEYLTAGHGTAFYPEITVAFTAGPGEHYHIPLLLAPYGYATYRGS